MPSYAPVNIQATATTAQQAVDGNVDGSNIAARAATISAARAADAQIDANAASMQQADAQRSIPRARTDNLNDQAGRHLTPPGEVVAKPSIFSHRMNRRNANRAIARLNPAQSAALASFVAPTTPRQRAIRDDINRHFESGGTLDQLGTAGRNFVRRLDGSIQKAERENDRMHAVYTRVNVPDGTSRREFLARLRANPGHHQTLAGYTRANHDLTKIEGNDNDLYVQIETSRGMYVGGNGSSGHVLPRNLELEFVNAGDFDVDDGQGGTTRRTLIQMREVRQDERTTARQ